MEDRSGAHAPFLPMLHDAMEQDGMMSEETLNELAGALRIAPAYVHQAAAFYHYSNLGKDHLLREGTCGGPTCCLPASG